MQIPKFTADEIAVNNLRYNKIKNKFKKYINLYDFYKKFELPEKFNKITYCKKKRLFFNLSFWRTIFKFSKLVSIR